MMRSTDTELQERAQRGSGAMHHREEVTSGQRGLAIEMQERTGPMGQRSEQAVMQGIGHADSLEHGCRHGVTFDAERSARHRRTAGTVYRAAMPALEG